ncbi:MAG: translation initiation factor [Flavobacteriales bacterium]|nr:translation initiation factor [Flavobacteriales bacterium]
MDLRDQLKNLFPGHEESDFSVEESKEKHTQKEPIFCKYEKKGRAGKPVTIIDNFLGDDEQLKELAKHIKSKLGVGGSVKDNQIIIQGNHRDKIMDILKEKGFKTKRIGG